MYCWKCGTKNDDQAANCTSCSSALLGHLAKALDGKTEGGASKFFSTRSSVRFHQKGDGTTEIVVEDDNGRQVYNSIDDAPTAIQEMLKKIEEGKSGSPLFNLDFDMGFSGAFKRLKDFKKGDVIEGETASSDTPRVTISSKKRMASQHPSAEVKSDVPWALILGAIIVAIALYVFVTTAQ